MSLQVDFEVSRAQAWPKGLFSLLPEDLNVQLSNSSPGPCLHACYHVPHHYDNELNL